MARRVNLCLSFIADSYTYYLVPYSPNRPLVTCYRTILRKIFCSFSPKPRFCTDVLITQWISNFLSSITPIIPLLLWHLSSSSLHTTFSTQHVENEASSPNFIVEVELLICYISQSCWNAPSDIINPMTLSVVKV